MQNVYVVNTYSFGCSILTPFQLKLSTCIEVKPGVTIVSKEELDYLSNRIKFILVTIWLFILTRSQAFQCVLVWRGSFAIVEGWG